jgi:hypothetical protein
MKYYWKPYEDIILLNIKGAYSIAIFLYFSEKQFDKFWGKKIKNFSSHFLGFNFNLVTFF